MGIATGARSGEIALAAMYVAKGRYGGALDYGVPIPMYRATIASTRLPTRGPAGWSPINLRPFRRTILASKRVSTPLT